MARSLYKALIALSRCVILAFMIYQLQSIDSDENLLIPDQPETNHRIVAKQKLANKENCEFM